VCAWCGPAGSQGLKYELHVEEIAPKTWGVFGAKEYFSMANGGNIVNVAFVETSDGVVLIDTGPSRRFGEALLEAIAAKAPGKPVLRVFNTHHHPDHFLGNQLFDRATIAAPQGVIDNIKAEGDAVSSNMYRMVGDWMRGTSLTAPSLALTVPSEEIGGRTFSYFYLGGHTSADLAVRDDSTGVLFAGDLAFLDRAPTTPSADIAKWRESIATLRGTDRQLLLPGHGPKDERSASLDQTLDWLDWLDGTVREAIGKGLTMNEAMQIDLPARFSALGVAQDEYRRSVVHLYQVLEDELLNPVDVAR
jgi:quinoprotein relay system zinc metallohydrolase 1